MNKKARYSQREPCPSRLLINALAIVAVLIPIATCLILSATPVASEWEDGSSGALATSIPFSRETIGPGPTHFPRITNVQVVDYDGDGLKDVIACDAQTHRVVGYRQTSEGRWQEQVLGEDLLVPAHTTVVDLDHDGDFDVIVAILGNIFPDDTRVGRVVWLENDNGKFHTKVLLDNVRRVADAQAGDLDGDGDLDIAVAVFGYARGRVLWLENRGDNRFEEHHLLDAVGAIHVPLADYDGDGDLDIATVATQDEEEVWGLENLGQGKFQPRLLHFNINYDIGIGGLVKCDLDSDGDSDLLLPVGDNFEDRFSFPKPYDGCFWLENQGGWKFNARRIATFPGTFAAAAGDLDADGDQDVVLGSTFNEWERAGSPSLVWLENDGHQNFQAQPQSIDERPTHLATVDCGDLDGDGRDDIVAGGLHVPRPYDRLGRVTAWISGRSDPRKSDATDKVLENQP